MTELFTSNLNIISQRWPAVASQLTLAKFDHFDANLVTGQNQTISIDGIQLSSRHNRLAEAQLFIEQLPKNCIDVTVYGVGMGDVISLLCDDSIIDDSLQTPVKMKLKTITVCPLNFSLFALLLCYTDQSEWLTDPRVNIKSELMQDVTDGPYIAITPDLLLIDDSNASLRDLLVYENNRAYANQRSQDNETTFLERLAANQYLLKRDPDAAILKEQFSQSTAYVIGTGPSLEQHYQFLAKERLKPLGKRPIFIAVDTALTPLISNGVIPDIVVSIEQNITREHFPQTLADDINLVYFPTVPTDVIEWWPGPKYNAYSQHVKYDAINKQLTKLRLFSNGSVLHPAIDLAVHLQASDITLFGSDFCYPNNKTHAHWQDGALGLKAEHAKHWVFNGLGEKVATELNFRGYLRSLEQYISAKPDVSFYQSSLSSARIKGACFKECN
ncbi:motility associated factor glycosyltransferase family protein [Shewanella pneumatophori]|uniref:DUF115 domain-containing protein n=1 Tax=Shewanella pneumatophori TaxID=314092 RepID=A0A9X1ZGQ6_9GAMM|nr:6-hydroxymethylpterin diphosphokinase MptE-like protein [Shewanella pneumatophori]MCL1139665.1 DUF115 domain-containing protein [Shewanella pneumatophori]